MVLAAVAAAASEVGTLMVRHADAGDALFVIALSGAVWLRRFGPALARVGTLLTLPFIALLVTPIPQLPGKSLQAWAILIAVIAAFWVAVTAMVADRLLPSSVRPRAQRAAPPAPTVPPRRPSSRRLPLDKTPIVLIFVVLFVATWLRTISYAYWAAAVTAVLSLLNGYFGQSDTALLGDRLGAIALGAVIALSAAWFVLPVRTTDVFRRRVADVLAALTDYLTALAEHLSASGQPAVDDVRQQERRLEHALDQLEQVAPALRAHRRLPSALRGDAPPPADAVAALLAIRQPARDLLTTTDQAAIAALRRRVITTRRSMIGAASEIRPSSQGHDPIGHLERALETTRRIVARPA